MSGEFKINLVPWSAAARETGEFLGMERAPTPVFVASSDDAMRSITANAAKQHGFEVREASTGDDLLKAIGESTLPVIVLMGWRLKGTSGVDLIRAIRERYQSQAYIVAITQEESQRIYRAFEGGADDAVAHPVDPRELRARLLRAQYTVASGGHDSLISSLQRGGAMPACEVVVRGAKVSARIHLHGGGVAWVQATPPLRDGKQLVADLGIDKETAVELIQESRRTGTPFHELCVDWGVVDPRARELVLSAVFREELQRLVESVLDSVTLLPRRADPPPSFSVPLSEVAPWIYENAVGRTSTVPPSERQRSPMIEELSTMRDDIWESCRGAVALIALSMEYGEALHLRGGAEFDSLAWTTGRALAQARAAGAPAEELLLTAPDHVALARFLDQEETFVTVLIVENQPSMIGMARYALGKATEAARKVG